DAGRTRPRRHAGRAPVDRTRPCRRAAACHRARGRARARHCRRPARDTAAARGVRLLLAPLVPGMRVAGYLDAQRIDRGVRATEQRSQVRTAEREVDSLLRPADDADAPAVRRHHPNTAWSSAINPADAIDLESVGDARLAALIE